MKINIKEKIEKVKQILLILTTKIVSIIAYWLGVSLSFLLWKISTIIKKETKKSYWIESEEEDEDYRRQY